MADRIEVLQDHGPVPPYGKSSFATRYEREHSPYDGYRRSSPVPVGSKFAESRYMVDQMRHSQYVSRYTLPHPAPEPVMVERIMPRLSQHQDFFVHELTAEVNELRSK